MTLNLDQLTTFIHIADLGSFTAAADKVGLTQPAVSLQLKLLELRLGVRLIERVGRRAQPTAAGLDLLTYARQIVQESIAAEEAMAPHREGVAGRVRVGSGATASIHLLPHAIAKAMKRMPGLEITVRIGNVADILRDLETNLLDLAVVALPAYGRPFEIEPFYEEEMLAVAHRDSDMPANGPDAAFLCEKPLLLYEGGNTRRCIDDWMTASGLRAKPTMEFGSVEAIKELVAAGLGWSILPELALKRNRANFLTTASVRPRLTRQLGMVLRRDKHLTRGLRTMMQCLRNFKD
ncbi:LysR family transcriptional regulator (plasmid) [Phyllobacterium zundukense]|uniref:LysR family transcriptional regulator n=1 Tax=Phyllobacterium zundukense TaxID=1867719 RepID=UPI000C1BE139|nr:LysR family transcriptional regulator [Phyllobacterium zundukense]ATU95821.1 LysR family transcriptional regulator [Phyllobacterium zundukense]